MAICKHNTVKELNSGLPRTNPDSSRVEDLNQGPLDFKLSALNYSATLSPLHKKLSSQKSSLAKTTQ